MVEQIYLNEQDLVVTSQRITIRSRTYFTRNVASVHVTMDENRLAWAIAAILLCWSVMAGLLGSWGYCVLTALCLAAVIKWMPFRLYYLTLDVSSGRVQALRGNRDDLLELKEFIERAITEGASR